MSTEEAKYERARRFAFFYVTLIGIAATGAAYFLFIRPQTILEEVESYYKRVAAGQRLRLEDATRFYQLISDNVSVRQWIVDSFGGFDQTQKAETLRAIASVSRQQGKVFSLFCPPILTSLDANGPLREVAVSCLEFYDFPRRREILLTLVSLDAQADERLVATAFRIYVSLFGLEDIETLTRERLNDSKLRTGFRAELATALLVKCNRCDADQRQVALDALSDLFEAGFADSDAFVAEGLLRRLVETPCQFDDRFLKIVGQLANGRKDGVGTAAQALLKHCD